MNDTAFQTAFAASGTLLPRDRAYTLWSFARYAQTLSGIWVECGVYGGGSAAILGSLGPTTLHLFDTFTGLPPGEPGKDNRYLKGGEYAAPLDRVKAKLKGLPVEFHPGLIPETLAGAPVNVSFVHLDLDLYRPTLQCLNFFYPRLPAGGVIVMDDFGNEECAGIRQAITDFEDQFRVKSIPLTTGQALVIKKA